MNKKYNEKLQFVVVARADSKDGYSEYVSKKMLDLKSRYPKNFFVSLSDPDDKENLLILAADFVLMPSLFEPSGLTQQKAFVSNSPVIGFKTGGLSITVSEFDKEKRKGNGLLFWCHKHEDFCMAIDWSYYIFTDNESYTTLRQNAGRSARSTEVTAAQWLNEFTRLLTAPE